MSGAPRRGAPHGGPGRTGRSVRSHAIERSHHERQFPAIFSFGSGQVRDRTCHPQGGSCLHGSPCDSQGRSLGTIVPKSPVDARIALYRRL